MVDEQENPAEEQESPEEAAKKLLATVEQALDVLQAIKPGDLPWNLLCPVDPYVEELMAQYSINPSDRFEYEVPRDTVEDITDHVVGIVEEWTWQSDGVVAETDVRVSDTMVEALAQAIEDGVRREVLRLVRAPKARPVRVIGERTLHIARGALDSLGNALSRVAGPLTEHKTTE